MIECSRLSCKIECIAACLPAREGREWTQLRGNDEDRAPWSREQRHTSSATKTFLLQFPATAITTDLSGLWLERGTTEKSEARQKNGQDRIDEATPRSARPTNMGRSSKIIVGGVHVGIGKDTWFWFGLGLLPKFGGITMHPLRLRCGLHPPRRQICRPLVWPMVHLVQVPCDL
ncbi:hypothetical protein Q3G72_015677 [Acer saccharum]|nr:hypothetical protein Q3G72_015677 [Acer saccharum]